MYMMVPEIGDNVFYVCSHTPGGGLYCFEILENGELNQLSFTYTDKPSYAIIHNGCVYALMREAEQMQSGIKRYDISPYFTLTTQETTLTHGAVAAHLCLFKEKLYCVNYLSGTTICLPDKIIAHNGSSVHTKRQTSSHPHQIQPTPDGKYLIVNDLGTDRIEIYTPELASLKFSIDAPKGSGPRHGVFSEDGKFYYCANELNSTVSVYKYSCGKLFYVSSLSTTPEGFYGENAPSAIRVRGKYVYVSNRGHDSICVFRRTGKGLKPYGFIDSYGMSPRDFDFCGDYLVCGNEDSANIAVFKMQDDGLAELCSIKKGIDVPWCITVYRKDN